MSAVRARPVLVYRDAILPRSEAAFMRRQYQNFSALRPLWVGRKLDAGYDAADFPLAALFSGLSGVLFKLFGLVPQQSRLQALGAVAVHAQFGRGGALALPLAKALGLPLIVTFHGGDAHKESHWKPTALLRRRLAALIAYADCFICVSAGVQAKLRERGVPAEKLRVHHIGVPLPDLPPRTAAGHTILFIGRFVEMKGAAVLVQALRLLRARGEMAQAVLIGDGPDRDEIARSLDGLANVELRGWQTQAQIAAALAEARCVIIPSVVAQSGEKEGLPSVAMEAMSHGAAIIASTDASTEGLISHGQNGLIFPSRDAAALADSIQSLLADADLALRLGAAGCQTIARDFNAATQSARLEAILLQAAGQN
jgi:glycosyltransferase involved in cell wall biosynthesis